MKVQVNTTKGFVEGRRQTYNVTGELRAVNMFKGIPYAKPPIGDLRFKVRRKHISIIHISIIRKNRYFPIIWGRDSWSFLPRSFSFFSSKKNFFFSFVFLQQKIMGKVSENYSISFYLFNLETCTTWCMDDNQAVL